MSYKEKRIIASIITGILVLAAYGIYAAVRYQSGMAAPEDMKFWALTILAFIGIGIAVSVVTQILFHVLIAAAVAVKESGQNGKDGDKRVEEVIGAEMVEDEMDKLISLKAMKFSFVIAGMGFVAALVSIVLGYSPVVMLNILFVSFCTGSLAEGFIQLYFYRRGIKHG